MIASLSVSNLMSDLMCEDGDCFELGVGLVRICLLFDFLGRVAGVVKGSDVWIRRVQKMRTTDLQYRLMRRKMMKTTVF